MRYNAMAVVVLLLLAPGALAQATLPVGAHPPALSFDHFPSRVHAFVWRNWNLVPAGRLAAVMGTSAQKVRQVAQAMGLPGEAEPPAMYKTRLYLTIIRRNWHLLPYDQLLELLEIKSEQLAYILREDDFFFIKLGSLKPRCERLTWVEPDDAARERCAAIAGIARSFDDEPGATIEPPFAFLSEITGDLPDSALKPKALDLAHPRFLYSYAAVFGDPLSDGALDPFPDRLLARLADLGVNGVWLHVVLRDLAPSKQFPEFGAGSEKRLENLARLVARARRFGVAVYLYMNEPRAMPPEFFEIPGRKELAGVREGDHWTMCTSQPAVRQWLADSLAHVFAKVPDLGGVFTITASENLTNCASHGQSKKCPRCAERKAGEIIAEVNAAIEEGVHRASPGANVIAWDWGWRDDDAPTIIAALPRSVKLQSVSEWSLPLERGGVKTTVGEYSISAVGPGPRATRHWALARQRGLSTMAKIQANCTWELSSVPYLPTMDLVARHATNLACAEVDGLMLSWSLGGYPSPNLRVFERLMRKDAPPADRVLDEIAADLFGADGAPHARQAWAAYSAAFENFPYNGAVLYNAPQQMGPANLLFLARTGYRATMVGIPYDDLDRWRGPYPREVFCDLMEKVASGFAQAEPHLQAAVAKAPDQKSRGARRELIIAQAARVHFASAANQARFVMIRDRAAPAAGVPDPRSAPLRAILERETQLARQLYRLQRQDSRIGFEASNHYFYLPHDLVEKAINCQWLAEKLPK